MDISITYDDGSENEFDLPLCCEDCSRNTHGFSNAQYTKVKEITDNGTTLKVPDDITTLDKLIAFIKSW